MEKRRITFDLDNVIFDMKPLYKEAFRRAGVPYVKPTDWDLYKSYNNAAVVENLLELFGDDLLYKMPVLDREIPYILNKLIVRRDLDVLFVTERKLKQPEKTFWQLRRAGIVCAINQVYDKDGKAVADYLTVKGEMIDTSAPVRYVDPLKYWKNRCFEECTFKRLHQQIFKDGELVYKLPKLDDIRKYVRHQLDNEIWQEERLAVLQKRRICLCEYHRVAVVRSADTLL